VSSSLPSVLSLARRGRYPAALSRLDPKLSGRLPPDIASFYAFSGDQDLISENPRHPALTPREFGRLEHKIGRLPPSLEKECLTAYARICAHRYAQARKKLSVLGSRHPADPRLALLEGLCLWLLGDKERTRRHLPKALAAADRAVFLRPSRQTLLLRAQVRFEFEDKNSGLRDLEKILKLHPNDLSALLGRVEGLADSFRYRPALKAIDQVLALRPGRWWALAQRGRLKGMCGRLPQAVRDFDEAIRRRPDRGALYAWRAEVLRQLGRYADARLDLDKALSRDASYAFGWELSGRLRLMMGQPQSALPELERACRLDPGRLLCFAWRAEARLKLGRLRQAWDDLERVYPLHPLQTWNTGQAREGAPCSRGQRQASLWKNLDDLIRRFPGESAAWLLRGRLKSAAGREMESLADLTRALQLCPSGEAWPRPAILGWRGRTMLQLGACEKALPDLAAAAALDPRSPRWGAWHGIALLKSGRADQGLRELRPALARPEPALAEAFFERGLWFSRAGRVEQAREDLRTAFMLNPPFERARRAYRLLGGPRDP
jgi:tetratricopeptide (TPR) repeat protein